MVIKQRLKRLEEKESNGYQETLDYLRLSWQIANSTTLWADPPPRVMWDLQTQAKELVNRGEILSIRALLKKIDGKSLPTINGG